MVSDAAFANLHDVIFSVFDRDDPHLYSFDMTGTDTKDVRRIRPAREISVSEAGSGDGLLGFASSGRSAKKARIGDVELGEGDVFHHLFDCGDEWWHRIRIEAVMESDARKKGIVLVKTVGASPAQFPDFDLDEVDEPPANCALRPMSLAPQVAVRRGGRRGGKRRARPKPGPLMW